MSEKPLPTQMEQLVRALGAITPLAMPGAVCLDDQQQQLLYAIGHEHYVQRKYEDALRVFWFLCWQDISEARYLKAVGACLREQKRHMPAALAYGLAWQVKPHDPVPLYYVADALLAEGMQEDAESMLASFIEQAENVPACAALRERAKSLLQAKTSSRGAAASAVALGGGES